MNYTEASIAHKEQWLAKHSEYIFPYNIRYKNDKFIEINININECKTQIVNNAIVNKYAHMIKNGAIMSPAWGLIGKRLQNGTTIPFWHKQVYIVDGNHRVNAYKQLDYKQINIIIPINT